MIVGIDYKLNNMIRRKSKKLVYTPIIAFLFGCNNPTTLDTKSNIDSNKSIKILNDTIKRPTSTLKGEKDTTSSYIGEWLISDYFFSDSPNNVSAFGNKEAKAMINKNVIKVYPNYLVEAKDSCNYDTLDIQTISTDNYLGQYNYYRKDLNLTTDSVHILKFRRKNDPDNLKYTCPSLNEGFIILDKNLIININGTFFLLKKQNLFLSL